MKPEEKFVPLCEVKQQVFLGRGIHTLGLIDWLLKQTGPAKVVVTTFSTSIEFLSGFHNLRKRGLIINACMVADLKACKKTVKLMPLMDECFDDIFLAENHSKVVLIQNNKHSVCIVSSQNNTYGGRIECTLVAEDYQMCQQLSGDINKMIQQSLRRK